MIRSSKSKRSPRQWFWLCLGAFFYTLLFSLCSQIEQYGSTHISESILRFLLAFPAAAIILSFFFRLMACKSPAPQIPCAASISPASKVRDAAISFAILYLCYIPMFLIQFPGSFTYDIMPQAIQAASGRYSTFHPLLHTLFLKACLSFAVALDSFELAAALCSVVQMAIVSWCFAMVCASVHRCFSRKASAAVLLFFCLYPVHMAFASTHTKDVMFSAFFALFMALALEDITRGSLTRLHRTLYVISGIFACLLRNNMFYAMAAWLVILLFNHKSLRRLALYTLAVFILAKGTAFTLEAVTNAESGPVREMLSIPAQQLARVRIYAGDQLTQQECEQMDSLFNQVNYERYDPTIADPIKDRISEQAVFSDPIGAAQFWLSLGVRHPGLYLDAFLHTMLPALYPYSRYSVSSPYIEIGECRIGLTQPFGLEQIQQPGRFASIRTLLNEQIFLTGADHHPILRWLFNSGLIFWLLLSQPLYSLYIGDKKHAAVMSLMVMLWGTHLLGPIMQGRYLYPFICIFPLFILHGRTCTKETL